MKSQCLTRQTYVNMLRLLRSCSMPQCHSTRSFGACMSNFMCSEGSPFQRGRLASSQVSASAFQLGARKSGRGRHCGRHIAPCHLRRGTGKHLHVKTRILPSAQSRDHFVPAHLVGQRPWQVTICIEGNISAGKSTFLTDIIEGSDTLKVQHPSVYKSFISLATHSSFMIH